MRELMRRKQQEKREKLLAEERRLQELQKIAMEGCFDLGYDTVTTKVCL